jgi:hypothetical protein
MRTVERMKRETACGSERMGNVGWVLMREIAAEMNWSMDIWPSSSGWDMTYRTAESNCGSFVR